MAEIKGMRKILMLITSVRVKIQLHLYERSLESFGRGIAWGPIKIHNGGN